MEILLYFNYYYKKIKFLFDNYYHIKYMRIEQYNNLIIQIDNL